MKQLDEKLLRDEVLSLKKSLEAAEDNLHAQDGKIDDLSRERKYLAESLEALQQRRMALEQDAQSILPTFIKDDAKIRLQKLAALVSSAIEATSVLCWELWPEHKD